MKSQPAKQWQTAISQQQRRMWQQWQWRRRNESNM